MAKVSDTSKSVRAIVAIGTLCLLVPLVWTACTDAQRGKFEALGEPAQVTQFSGGQQVGKWCSTGKVASEDSSDGYYFTPQNVDVAVIEVSGDVRIEYNHPNCQ